MFLVHADDRLRLRQEWQANKITDSEWKALQDAPFAQLPCGKWKKTTRQLDDAVWKGPYHDTDNDVRRLYFMKTFSKDLLAVGVLVPDMTLFSRNEEIWVRFPQLSHVPSSQWSITVHKDATDFEKSIMSGKNKVKVTKTVKVVDRGSMKLNNMTEQDAKVWDNWTITSQVLIALMARFFCGRVPIGDSGPWNLLLDPVSSKIYSIDHEEARTSSSIPNSSKDVEDIYSLIMCNTKKPSLSVRNRIAMCCRRHGREMRPSFDAFKGRLLAHKPSLASDWKWSECERLYCNML